MSDALDFYTIIGRYVDSGDVTAAVIDRTRDNQDPHRAALAHTGLLSEGGEFEVLVVLQGRCQVLVTQQSLSLYTERLLAGEP